MEQRNAFEVIAKVLAKTEDTHFAKMTPAELMQAHFQSVLRSDDEDAQRMHLETAALCSQIVQAEVLTRIAVALEELAACVDPEVAFFWTREFRGKNGE